MISKKYAGIGARKTPSNILKEMTRIATWLEKRGHILRSGAAAGADSAFEAGVSTSDNCEIYLPWRGFSKHPSNLYTQPKKAFDVARVHHPRWANLTDAVKKLMARNSQQVLGSHLDELSDFVICWTPDGKDNGGTGQAIRVSRSYHVPVYNLYNENDREELRDTLREIKTT